MNTEAENKKVTPKAPQTSIPKANYPSPDSYHELINLVEKQGRDLADIRSMMARELGRQKMRRFVKFIYHFVLIAAIVISLVTGYVFINEQLKELRAFTDKIGGQADSVENFTKDSLKSIEDSISGLNVFK